MTATTATPAATSGSRSATTATRRATVARLLAENVSQIEIARRLGVSKHVVWRDIRALERDAQHADQQQPQSATRTATDGEVRDLKARRAAEAGAAMRTLAEAVAAAVDAEPSHVMVPAPDAHAWAGQLREHIASLARLLAGFAECYPEPE
ncbi:HTH domain-containing protein [Streptomyces albipurpureus]|uniref:Helix-turn-helix domain-containing protein n=1 Tax=Streptomyces albipurpureus TaxID=2897419 RepID=A0ABT0USF9_9ACTN|nr:HTH domain-containing protein [Streptomyces sp. CWNU-1]MCM2390176.1 helix-turn-helix domain-containing protein [Streptomyces sp. CWNU-1]